MKTATDNSELRAIADKLLDAPRIVVASHVNPDGDALGSTRSLQLMLQSLGKDVISYIPDGIVPREYEFVRPEALHGSVPDDIESRLLICVDCGNESRIVDQSLLERAQFVCNVDHHGDNTRFGDLNHVRPDAACATQLVHELATYLGVDTIDAETATALYVGLVTDTGRFQYSNTTPEAFELAADLVRNGVDTHDVFSRLYENVEFQRAKLLGRALTHAVRSDDGTIVATHLSREDFAEVGANEDDAEGIVDALRSVEGTAIAVFLRDLEPGGAFLRKGSLRTTREDVDVSIIARTWSGGGHRQAAGFSTNDDLTAVLERVESSVAAQLAAR